MSHPDPYYDPDNSYEDDMNYDDYDAFYGEDSASYHPDAEHELSTHYNEFTDEVGGDPEYFLDEDDIDGTYDDSMDGDTDSALGSVGWGTDEYYGHYDDIDAFHDYYGDTE